MFLKISSIITNITLIIFTIIIGYKLFISTTLDRNNLVQTLQCFSFIIAAYGVFFGCYYNISQKNTKKKIRILDAEFKKKEESFRLISRWDNEIILKARDFSRVLKRDQNNISPNDLIKLIEQDNEKASAITVLYNYAEHIKVAVKYDLVNPEIIGQVSEILESILNRFHPYIDKIIQDRPNEIKSFQETKKILEECTKARAKSLAP